MTNEILRELRERYMLLDLQDGEITTGDLAQEMNIDDDVARNWLKKEVREGRLTQRWAKGPTGQRVLAFKKRG